MIFDPSRFLETIEPTLDGETLPQSWDVTSDSIAARIARLLTCHELVLLKSCLPPPDVNELERAADLTMSIASSRDSPVTCRKSDS